MTTAWSDRAVKLSAYAAGEIDEVWLVVPGADLMTCYRHPEHGRYLDVLDLDCPEAWPKRWIASPLASDHERQECPYDVGHVEPECPRPPITGDPEADDLNVRDPLALLTGILLDQQIQSTSAARPIP